MYAIINFWLLVPRGSSVQLLVGISYPFSSLGRVRIAVSDSWTAQPTARGDEL
jgi:hypothetical protein